MSLTSILKDLYGLVIIHYDFFCSVALFTNIACRSRTNSSGASLLASSAMAAANKVEFDVQYLCGKFSPSGEELIYSAKLEMVNDFPLLTIKGGRSGRAPNHIFSGSATVQNLNGFADYALNHPEGSWRLHYASEAPQKRVYLSLYRINMVSGMGTILKEGGRVCVTN